MILYPDTEKELYFEKDYKQLPNLDIMPLPELRQLLNNVQTAAGNAALNGSCLLEMALFDDLNDIKKAIKAATEKAVKTGEIIAIIYINCDKFPFIDWIMQRKKLFETRNKNTLKMFIGCRVLLAETHKGIKPVVRCSATIAAAEKITDPATWNNLKPDTMIKDGSGYDWKANTTQKYIYKLSNVRPVRPFTPEGIRHGRTWIECTKNK